MLSPKFSIMKLYILKMEELLMSVKSRFTKIRRYLAISMSALEE